MKLNKDRLKHLLSIDLVKDSLKLSSSNLLLYLLPLVVTPILSRIYTPSDYGEWGIFASVYMIVSYVLFLSYDNAIIRTNEEDEISNLCILCIIMAVCVLLSLCAVFSFGCLVGLPFFKFYPRFDLLIMLLSICIINNLLLALANRYKKYTAMTVTNIVNGLLQAVFRIVIGFTAIVSSGLIVGVVCAHVGSIIVLFVFLSKINFAQVFPCPK